MTFKKGQKAWNKGLKLDKNIYSKIGFKKGHKINNGRIHSKDYCRKLSEIRFKSNPMKNKDISKKVSVKLAGRHTSTKTEFKSGHLPWNTGLTKSIDKRVKNISDKHIGKKATEQHKKNISLGLIGIQKGEKHHNWQGGISFEPYTTDWTDTLKKSIRERDHYICQICSKDGMSVHHIDYNKKNCNPSNLITLCNSCHIKTNFNRNKWQYYFTNLLLIKQQEVKNG